MKTFSLTKRSKIIIIRCQYTPASGIAVLICPYGSNNNPDFAKNLPGPSTLTVTSPSHKATHPRMLPIRDRWVGMEMPAAAQTPTNFVEIAQARDKNFLHYNKYYILYAFSSYNTANLNCSISRGGSPSIAVACLEGEDLAE